MSTDNNVGIENSTKIKKNLETFSMVKKSYSNCDNLKDFFDLLNNNPKDIVKSVMKTTDIPKNKEIIDYVYKDDNCNYFDKTVSSVIDFAIDKNHVDLLEVTKNRHPEFLTDGRFNLTNFAQKDIKTQEDKEVFKFVLDNGSLMNYTKDSGFNNLLTESMKESKKGLFDKVSELASPEVKEDLKLIVIENINSFDNDKKLDNLFNKLNLSDNELKSVFVNSFPVNNDLQNGASNNVFNYMKDKFKFTDKTYNDTFERAVEGNNIEVANRLVLEENIKPKITVLNKIKEEMPELYKVCENKILNEKTNKEVIIKRQKNDIDFKM